MSGVLVTAIAAAGILAPAWSPSCTDVAADTRMCVSAGHTAIVTSPDPAYTNPYPGWGFGSLGTPGVLGRPAIDGRGLQP